MRELKREKYVGFFSLPSPEFQFAEGILPHRSALGFPGLAGGFTFTIYGWSCSEISSALFFLSFFLSGQLDQNPNKRSRSPNVNLKKTHCDSAWQVMRLAPFFCLRARAYVPIGNNIFFFIFFFFPLL